MKQIVQETESDALAEYVEEIRQGKSDILLSSLLLHAELHCASNRHPRDIQPNAVDAVLSTIALVDLENSDLTTAPLLPGRPRSADAIHLATALRVDAHAMIVYNNELQSTASLASIQVISPS